MALYLYHIIWSGFWFSFFFFWRAVFFLLSFSPFWNVIGVRMVSFLFSASFFIFSFGSIFRLWMLLNYRLLFVLYLLWLLNVFESLVCIRTFFFYLQRHHTTHTVFWTSPEWFFLNVLNLIRRHETDLRFFFVFMFKFDTQQSLWWHW